MKDAQLNRQKFNVRDDYFETQSSAINKKSL